MSARLSLEPWHENLLDSIDPEPVRPQDMELEGDRDADEPQAARAKRDGNGDSPQWNEYIVTNDHSGPKIRDPVSYLGLAPDTGTPELLSAGMR